ncbi:ArnT family glycosyltransferase [Acidobacteriota bacterium]
MDKRTFSFKEKVHRFILSDVFFLAALCLFIFINWLLMIRQDILACNDYYQYYFAQEKLFSGNLNLEFIPPLFPFLLGLFGRLARLFGGTTDHFILGGQIISLFSGFGVLIFSYKLLKKCAPGLAVLGTIFLSISPFFLKLLSTAQTDMLYLFFAAALFYFLTANHKQKRLQKKLIYTIGFTAAGLLTRFEGVLLIGSFLINYIDLKKRSWKYLLLSTIPAGLVLYFLFDRFAHRLIEKIALIVSKGYYLYYFAHPGELVHLLYGNLLYFLPHKTPPLIKWFLFYVLVGLFFAGIYYLFKKGSAPSVHEKTVIHDASLTRKRKKLPKVLIKLLKKFGPRQGRRRQSDFKAGNAVPERKEEKQDISKKQWVLAVIFYMLIFVLAKRYTQALQPEMEFRRWLSIIWLFFIIALTGTHFLWHRIREVKRVKIPVKSAFALFCVLVMIFLPVIKGTAIRLALFLLPALLYGIKKTTAKIGKWEFAGWFLVLAIFFSQVYYDGLKRSFFYLSKDSNAGSYMVAKWVNTRPVDEKTLVYAYWPMFHYYVDKGKRRGAVVFKEEKIYSDREKLLTKFTEALKKRKIKYIAFDGYRSPMYKARNAIKDLLYQERDKGVYFKVKKHLFYKGKYTASVLMPK